MQQDLNSSETGNVNAPLEGESVTLCGIQRGNESYPCTNVEPCELHCGAKTRGERAGRKCSNYAMPNGRCRMHSGRANRGIGHPRFRDGSDSRYTPKGIQEAYEQSLAEETRTTENREELALITGYIEQVLEEMEGDSEDWFTLLNRMADGVEDADGVDQDLFRLRVAALINVIRRGTQKYQKRRELREWIDLRRRTSESETRRLEKEHQMMTRENVLLIMHQMGQIIYEEVKDRRVRARIAERAARLTS